MKSAQHEVLVSDFSGNWSAGGRSRRCSTAPTILPFGKISGARPGRLTPALELHPGLARVAGDGLVAHGASRGEKRTTTVSPRSGRHWTVTEKDTFRRKRRRDARASREIRPRRSASDDAPADARCSDRRSSAFARYAGYSRFSRTVPTACAVGYKTFARYAGFPGLRPEQFLKRPYGAKARSAGSRSSPKNRRIADSQAQDDKPVPFPHGRLV